MEITFIVILLSINAFDILNNTDNINRSFSTPFCAGLLSVSSLVLVKGPAVVSGPAAVQ